MKYAPPVGSADPNAPYVDGNPSTGIEGSPVPAAAIEHPMREILAVIAAAGLTPNEANLHQLLDALGTLFQAKTGDGGDGSGAYAPASHLTDPNAHPEIRASMTAEATTRSQADTALDHRITSLESSGMSWSAKPQEAAGVGQWVLFAGYLPAGGAWAYYGFGQRELSSGSDNGGTQLVLSAGVKAGGSPIRTDDSPSPTYFTGFAWRI